MKPQVKWPLMIGGLLSIPFIVGAVAIAKTAGDPSFAIEPDYYQKAVRWDDEVAQRQANRALGWRVVYDVQRGEKRPVLTAKLTDGAGNDVVGADVAIATSHNARGNAVVSAKLLAAPEGYSAPVELFRPGLWEVRLTATRGKDVFTDIQHIDVGEGGPLVSP
jgi:nitrogen fixation protein FixH